ncbi:hypothetical protein D8827_05755 [Streptococcus intermedius]|uniref:Uncharacterized protein n=1 Tax=Streptococcus intermedius TaxID=1338 RepID=A0AAE8G375_STRIT|nr:hypothetical protein [Streptococcus intermedius]RSJ23157.1 hypothetical protein D8827_05755 [Streptococcus intermedius]
MTYKVIRAFADTTDKEPEHQNGYPYEVGETYPRDGFKPKKSFVQSLCNGTNTTGSIFLVFKEEPTVPEKDNTPEVDVENAHLENDLPAETDEQPKKQQEAE